MAVSRSRLGRRTSPLDRPCAASSRPPPTCEARCCAEPGPGADALAAEVRRVVGEAREDGTLSQLSMRRFGLDLTAPPST